MNFVSRFFLLVLVLSFIEVSLLVYVAGKMGFLATVAFCILTGIIGGSLVRQQGFETLRAIQRQASQGQIPAAEMVSGLILLVVGVLLLTPGFVTDTFGFLMLIPALRKGIAKAVTRNPLSWVSFSGMRGGSAGVETEDSLEQATARKLKINKATRCFI